MTSEQDTLLVVAADHGHVLTIAGYPARGNPILGLSRNAAGELTWPWTASRTPRWGMPTAAPVSSTRRAQT